MMFQLPRQRLLVDLQEADNGMADDRTLGDLGASSPLFVIMLLAENLGMWNGLTDFHQSVSAEEEAFIILKLVL